MKKLIKTILALVFAACCFMFAAKCLNAGGLTGAIADFPTAIHRAVKGQMQTTTDYLNGEQTEYDESVFTGEYHYYYEKLSDDDKLIYRQNIRCKSLILMMLVPRWLHVIIAFVMPIMAI